MRRSMIELYWNDDTIEHFKAVYKERGRTVCDKQIEMFVTIDTTPENNETLQDLINDLKAKVYERT